MSEPLLRLVIVAIVVMAAGSIALLLNRFRRPPHPSVDLGDLGDRPGVVLFTSTTCPPCKDAIAALEGLGIPFREVTEELEVHRFEDAGVVAVPVTVFVDADGTVTDTFSGVHRTSTLRRAAARAGLDLR